MGNEAETSGGPASTSLSEREALADERERRLDERERRLDERTRAIKTFVKKLEEESLDLIENLRALLAAGEESSDRPGAAGKRPGGRGEQEKAVAGAAAGSKPGEVPVPADLEVPIERAIALRNQLRATLAALVATEEEVALVHDKIAAGRPDNIDQYWLAAAEARTRARRLRGIERHFHD